jgi:hypothetical protein
MCGQLQKFIVFSLLMAVLSACGIAAPRQEMPEDPGPRVSAMDSDDAGYESVTLTHRDAALTVDYPANWQFQRLAAPHFIVANGENIIGRYAQGTLESAILTDDEVVIDVRLVPRETILASNDDLPRNADAVELLEAVFQSLAPIRNEGISPIEMSFDEFEAATQTFNLGVLEYTVILVELGDNYFATVYISNGPEEYIHNWDEIAEEMVESFEFQPAEADS